MFAHRIILTGSSGFLGKAVKDELETSGHKIFTPRSKDYNLIDMQQCRNMFADMNDVDTVIHLAATCGGIQANKKQPGIYFYNNISMGINIVECCRLYEIKKLILVGTVCSYPKYCEVPFKEKSLWNGYPEETNAAYGIAKKSLYVMAQAYRQQYGLNSNIVIPSNLYGPNDNFDENKSHVIPALIKKINIAKQLNTELVVWGDGSATRDFLYVQDAADAIIKSINIDTDKIINLGNTVETNIKDLVNLLCDIMEYKGKIIWDKTKPNGQPRRCVDTTLAKSILNWQPTYTLEQGLRQTIGWYNGL